MAALEYAFGQQFLGQTTLEEIAEAASSEVPCQDDQPSRERMWKI